ncbi:LamG-like jellyroll fold domain-containing protein, partial [Verrucomicrobiota bacterium]
YVLGTDSNGVPYFRGGASTATVMIAARVEEWTHLAGTCDGTNLRLYVNGYVSAAADLSGSLRSGGGLRIGCSATGTNYVDGRIDEVAIHDRELGSKEILDHYRSAAVSLKFQCRSSDILPMSGSFYGPGRSTTAFFVDPSGNDLKAAIDIGRYFQYKAYLESEDHRVTPVLCGVAVVESSYPTNSPAVEPVTSQGFIFPGRLSGFSDTVNAGGPGTIVEYQVTGDSGGSPTWYYWNGSWAVAGGGYPMYTSSANDINSNLDSFYDQLYDGTGGNFRFKAFLYSDGAYQVELDQVEVTASPGSIVVTSPNGAETNDNAWLRGTPNTITWATAGVVAGTVTIQYSLNGGTNWTSVASGVTATDCSQPWFTPHVVSSSCLVRVYSDTDPAIHDGSDGQFELVQRYRIYDHNGGAPKWYIGETNILRWGAASGLGSVDIDFSGNDTWEGSNVVRLATFSPSLGGQQNNSFIWTNSASDPMLLSETAKLRIKSSPASLYTDYSDSDFVMAGAVLTSPAEGAKVDQGDTHDVAWKSAGCGANVTIEIQTQAGGPWFVAASNVPNATGWNTYEWSATNNPTDEARLRVTSGSDSRARGLSDTFTVRGFRFSEPVSDAVWESGNHNILYTSAGLDAGASGDLYLSFLGQAGPFSYKVNSSPVFLSAGTHMWNIPPSITATTNAVLRYEITNAPSIPGDVGYVAYSDSFTLQPLSKMHYVSLQGAHVYPFTNWLVAATNIQAGVDAAVDGDTVWVSNGVHVISNTIEVTKGLTLKSFKGPGATVVDGSNAVLCLRVDHVDAVVEGFTITGGYNDN